MKIKYRHYNRLLAGDFYDFHIGDIEAEDFLELDNVEGEIDGESS